MKNILKPIFEMITGEYILFDNILYNYIAMGVIGLIALKTAWNVVGNLYDLGIIEGRKSGSIIHWGIRFFVFMTVFYFCNLIIWLSKFIYSYRIIAFIVFVLLIIFITTFNIFKIIKKK